MHRAELRRAPPAEGFVEMEHLEGLGGGGGSGLLFLRALGLGLLLGFRLFVKSLLMEHLEPREANTPLN